ncbi:MAG: CsgG/HfaB family protein [Planctomycetaceae bacterium]
MLKRKPLHLLTAMLAVVLYSPSVLTAQEKDDASQAIYPVAVIPFQERGRDAAELGTQVSDLLFAKLVINPDLYLVEREDISKLFEEKELNLSGLVNPAEAVQVGHLTGAKIIVTGSVVVAGDSQYLVAKIIGTETSRVLGASAKGRVGDDLESMVDELAGGVIETITGRASSLVSKPQDRKDRIAELKKALGKGRRPSVWIDVQERHIGQNTIDPAVETELALICRELGFEVIDRKAGNRGDADVALIGEGFSQFASRRGNLTSVKARLELKALDPDTGRVLAIDREVSVTVDLAEQIAAKSALQEAAAVIAGRLLPKIVKK